MLWNFLLKTLLKLVGVYFAAQININTFCFVDKHFWYEKYMIYGSRPLKRQQWYTYRRT